LVLVLVVIVLNLPGQTMARFKLAISGLFLPLFGLASSSQQLTEDAADLVVPRGDLVRETDRLQRENQMIRLRLLQAEEAMRENERLRNHLEWQRQAPWRVKLARVVVRDPANWWRTLQINRGSLDGVTPNMPVLTDKGLVGRISLVGHTRSQVVLLGDPNLRVGAVVQRTRDNGVITATGIGPLENNLVDLLHLPRNSQIVPDDIVTTSGEGGIFPAGIPIGRVVDLRHADYGLTTEARVQLSVEFSKLEEVFILFP
jgi:rod shape-determining protein MreC